MSSNIFSNMGFVQVGQTPPSGTLNCLSIDTGLVATGSNAATALALVSSLNVIVTAAASTGVSLPAVAAPGALVDVINVGTLALSAVYPPTGGTINGAAVNVSNGTIAAQSGVIPGSARFVQTAPLTYISR